MALCSHKSHWAYLEVNAESNSSAVRFHVARHVPNDGHIVKATFRLDSDKGDRQIKYIFISPKH